MTACVPYAHADLNVSIEWPKDAKGHDAYWAVVQNGQIVSHGSTQYGKSIKRAPLLAEDGQGTFHIAINRDEYKSHFPSFGDQYQRMTFEIAGGKAKLRLKKADWQTRTTSVQEHILTVHYHRFDGDYQNVGLWTWDEQETNRPAEQETFEVGRDEFGSVLQIDVSLYGEPGDRIGLLPRMNQSWQFKDGPDRYWSPDLGPEVYIVQDDDGVYVTAPDIRPTMLSAMIEKDDVVAVRFTHRLPIADFPLDRFNILDDKGATLQLVEVGVEDQLNNNARVFLLRTAKPMDFMKRTYELVVAGLKPRRISLGGVLVDPKRFYDPHAKMGVQYSPSSSTFSMFSPVAESAEVVLADAHVGGSILGLHPMVQNSRGVWSVSVPGNWAGKFYSYRVKGPGLDQSTEVTDIYATCTTGPGGRGLIVDLDATDPPDFDPSERPSLDSPVDAIIYEMHVRDFTIDPRSGVTHKGKYLGLTETGTHWEEDTSIKTGIDHLVEMGVTHVQIMPIQDFENQETPSDSYNWGYMPVFFNSPDGWYATVPVGPERITEFKRVVQVLHEHGIGVIMDVVYNHTAGCASFERLVPGYYHRRRPDGTLWNGSGCGNELASEHPMTRKYMVDSLKYWVSEYGVDGYRFDLMGLHDLETMKIIRDELHKIDKSVLVYGEPWTGGASGLNKVTNQSQVAGTGLAAFNDHFRDAIKGDRDGGGPGFIQTGDRIGDIRKGIRAAIEDWAKQPYECITYCACHDNLTTWDKIIQAAPDAPVDVQKRMQRFAGLLVLSSQGISFIHSGQELCRTKQGISNSYNHPDTINLIDWGLKKSNADVYAYYRGLIELRKAHPCFRLRTAAQIKKRLRFVRDVPAERFIAYTIDGRNLSGEANETTLVLLNGESTDQEYSLPAGQWHLFADSDRASAQPLGQVRDKIVVRAHSGAVLGK